MADPERLSVTSSGTPVTSDVTETSESDSGSSFVPLSIVTLNQQAGYFRQQQQKLPELPSKRFQFTVWHELRESDIRGDQLRAPRVRRGPEEKEREFYEALDEENQLIHHSFAGKERDQHRNQLENWETAKLVNLTYQDLSDKYQRGNMGRILERLHQVVYLNLTHNGMLNLSNFSFPQCEYLNLSNNHIASFKCLPRIPRIKYLMIADNDITNLDGLKKFRSSPIDELYITGNPITFLPGYRHRVFMILPCLNILDGIPRLESDSEPPEPEESAKSCVVS